MRKTIEKIILSNSVDEIKKLYKELKEKEIKDNILEEYLSNKVLEEKVLILAIINSEEFGKKYEDTIKNQDYFFRTKYGFNIFHYIGIVNNYWILPLLKKSEKINTPNSLGFPPIYMCDNEKMIELMVEKGADPNIKENNLGQSSMFSSCADSNKVYSLLKAGANPNQTDSEGNTPLMIASEKGYIQSAKTLLLFGANPNLLDKDSDGALNTAARKGYLEIVKLLVENGAIEVFGSEGNTSLMEACHYGHYEIAKYLLNTISNINSVNEEGFSSLMKAVHFNQLEIVKLLIKRGANLLIEDNKGWNALSWAVSNYINNKDKKSVDIIKLLIDEDFRIIGQNQNNKSPIFMKTLIDIFIENDSYDFFSKRLEQVDILEEEQEKLKIFYRLIEENDLDLLKNKLMKNKEVNIKGYSNYTLLMHSLASEKIDCFNLLIELGADIHCRSYRGYTALTESFKVKDRDVFKTLIELGADIYEIDNNGWNLIYFAVQVGNLEVIEELLKMGLDINKAGNDGRTVLHLACLENKVEIVERLIELGSNLELEDNKGDTPLLTAIKNSSDEIIEFLLNKGANFKKINHKNLDLEQLCLLLGKDKILKKIKIKKIEELDRKLGIE